MSVHSLRELQDQLEDAERRATRLREQRDRRIREALRAGNPQKLIANITGLSSQRITQIASGRRRVDRP